MRVISTFPAVAICLLVCASYVNADGIPWDYGSQGYSFTHTEADEGYYQWPGCSAYASTAIKNLTDSLYYVVHMYSESYPYFWTMNHSKVALPSNATIDFVYVYSGWTWNRPGQWAWITTDNWTTSTPLAYHYGGAGYPSGGLTLWNVTDYRAWTVDMIQSADTGIKVQLYVEADTYYYFKGLVFGVLWHYPEQEVGFPDSEEGGETEGVPWSYTILTGNGLVGVMGIIGLCGMIAIPAMAVVAFRTSDDTRIGIFVKSLVTFMFCLTMFLVSISA